jgi:hypothetical protein
MDGQWWHRYLRRLLYGVQFSADPAAEVCRGLDAFFRAGEPEDAGQYVRAIETALASDEALMAVVPGGPHPQSAAAVRAYLVGMAAGIAARGRNSADDVG